MVPNLLLDPAARIRRSCSSRARWPRCDAVAPCPDGSVPVRNGSIRYAVTAARGSQPIADVLADVTVIGRDEIARAGAQSLTELLQRQPGVEIIQNGGPGIRVRGLPARREPRPDAGAGRRHPASRRRAPARRRSRRFRSTRSTGSRSCAGRRRASTARTRSAASCRCSPGAGPQTFPATRARVTARTAPGTQGRRVRHVGPGRTSRCRAAAKASNGFNAIVDPANFLFNADHDGYENQSMSANAALHWARRTGAHRAVLPQPAQQQFDGGPGFDDRTITTSKRGRSRAATRLAPFWVSRLSAGDGIDDSVTETAFGDFPFKTTQRQYTWQNELTLPLGMLTAGFERREERIATDAAFAVTAREHRFGVRHLPVAHGDQLRCRRICATTIRASTAARRRAPSPTATGSRRRCA